MANELIIQIQNLAKDTIKTLDSCNDDAYIAKVLRHDIPESISILENITGKHFLNVNKLYSENLSKTDVIKLLNNIIETTEEYEDLEENEMIEILNIPGYYNLLNAFSTKRFTMGDEYEWPAVDISDNKINAIAELKPDPHEVEPYLSDENLNKWKTRVSQHLMSMDDTTADIMDILVYTWLSKAIKPDSFSLVYADDFLKCRGIKPQKSSSGRRGGYKKEMRKNMANHIGILATTWITVHEMDLLVEDPDQLNKNKYKRQKWRGDSPLIVVEYRFGRETEQGELDTFMWNIKPGFLLSRFLFGPGRNIILLCQKALKYDASKYSYEKRLARYFSWHWDFTRNSTKKKYSVGALLKEIRKEVDSKNPIRTKERFEEALEKLVKDKVIEEWKYEDIDVDKVGTKGWVDYWLQCKIIVEAPRQYVLAYLKQNYKNPKQLTVNTDMLLNEQSPQYTMADLKAIRKGKKYTLQDVAKESGVSISTLSRAEKGTNIAPDKEKLILDWINGQKAN